MTRQYSTSSSKIKLLLLALTAYIALPYLAVQVANLGLIREGKRARREVALTFDDGPDPRTTPAVLDALAAAGAKATFFVLADKAEQHPDLIARILREGHGLEAHAEKHVHTWIRTPWGAFLDPGRAAWRIQKVSSQPVKLHRPPHGAYTLATLLGQRRAGLTGAHWSIESHDWHGQFSPQMVRERLNTLLVPGAVVVLHDAGPGAKNTVPVLPDLLADLTARGYKAVRLDELEGAAPQDFAFIKRRAFSALDSLYDHFGHIRYSGNRADNLFRVGPAPFPLTGSRLDDGLSVPHHAPAAEFHVNNALIVDIGPRRAVRQGPGDFAALARDLRERPDLQAAQYVFCLSSLAPLLALVGFETHDIPPQDARRLRGWAEVLRGAYGSKQGAQEPKLSILSRQRFLELFGEKP